MNIHQKMILVSDWSPLAHEKACAQSHFLNSDKKDSEKVNEATFIHQNVAVRSKPEFSDDFFWFTA